MLDPKTPLGQLTFVAFDTETTGVGAGHKIVELAGSKFRGDEFLGRFEALIDPGTPMSDEVIAVHQITNEMLRGRPKANEVLRDFFAFAEDAVLIAHNAAFDCGMIGLELARHRMPAPRNAVLDSLKAARRMYPGSAHSLDALIDLVGLPPQEERHRAFADAELVRHLLRRMVEALGGDATPLAKLIEQSGRHECLDEYLPPAPTLSEALRFLEQACRNGTKANIHVDTGGSRPQQRIVNPRLCYQWKGVAYLEAFCPEAGHDQLFRLDKLCRAEAGASSGFLF